MLVLSNYSVVPGSGSGRLEPVLGRLKCRVVRMQRG